MKVYMLERLVYRNNCEMYTIQIALYRNRLEAENALKKWREWERDDELERAKEFFQATVGHRLVEWEVQ